MEVLYPRCCGLDVHKSSITACVLIAQSGKPLKHIRRFGCTTRELRELVLWLQEFGVEPLVIRDLRDLTRARTSLSQEHSRIASRIQKVLEDANLKARKRCQQHPR